MEKFRKKPGVIEAIQLTKSNIREVYELVYGQTVETVGQVALGKWEDYKYTVIENGMNIPTLEDGEDGRAKHVASIGDWIIQGVAGEFYPCKPEIFEQTYDKYEIAYNGHWVTDNERFFNILLESKYEPEYEKLLGSGMFWEFYPGLSGEWEKDKEEFIRQLELTRKNGTE